LFCRVSRAWVGRDLRVAQSPLSPNEALRHVAMNTLLRKILLRALGSAVVLGLVSCGGGDGPPTQPLPQTIGFTSPGNQTLGAARLSLSAVSTSGLTVAFASSTPSVCTVSGSVLTLIGTGTCTVVASQGGDATFAPAAALSSSFSVAAAPQTITFISPGNQRLGIPPAALLATATSGLAVSLTSATTGVCTVSGSVLNLLAIGTCTVNANQAGSNIFAAAATVSQTFAVDALLIAQSISFNSPGNQTLGSATPPLVAGATSGLPVSLASTSPGVCTVTGTSLALLTAGSCTLAASQGGNATYAAAVTVLNTFSVAGTPQSINFAGPGNQTLGAAPLPLVATATSGLPVTFASTTPAVCSVSGNTLTLVALGSCTVNANQPGNASFAAALQVARTFVVSALTAQTITFNSPGNQTLGMPPAALVASASSGLVVSFASSTPGVCSVSGNALTLIAVGTCTVNATQAGNATFAAAVTVARTFAVAAAALLPQTISFASPGNQTLGTTPPPLVATASSGLAVSFASTTPSTCTVSGNTMTLVALGTCIIDANQAGNATYAVAPTVSRVISIVAAPLTPQAISFGSPGSQTVGTMVALSATASSGLVVTFTSSTVGVCTVSGSTLTLVATGSCTVNADQAGNSTYAAAPTVAETFAVATAAIEYFANGGFETAGSTTPALAWLAAASGYTRSSDARSGAFSARLSSVAFSAAVMLQNGKEQGMRPNLVVGSSPTLTFWAKGAAGGTGNVLFALRYLDDTGNIKANSMNQFFQASINPNTWTQITFNLGPVPVGATAAFIEFSQAIGPIDAGNPAGTVLIDDLSLK